MINNEADTTKWTNLSIIEKSQTAANITVSG